MANEQATPADDVLRGVKAIAAFIGEDDRATYHKLATGRLPAGKEGPQWIASKAVLKQHYARLTRAAEAA